METLGLQFTTQRCPIPTGAWIKSLRQRLQLSQSNFARAYKLDLKSLQQWEQGRRHPEQGTCLLLLMIDCDHEEVKRLIAKIQQTVDTHLFQPEKTP